MSSPTQARSVTEPSLYIRLVAATSVICAFLIAIAAAMIWHSRVETIHTATREVDRLALSLAQEATDALTIDEAALADLVERIEVDGVSPGQLRRLHSIAVSNVAHVPSLHGLFVIDRFGRPVATALSVTPKRLNYSDNEDFRFHASHTSGAFHVGPAIRSKSDGSWIFTLSRRLNDAHGAFAGIASCTISVRYFQKLYGSVELGPDGLIDLIRDDGTVLVRTPFKEKFLGRDLSGSDLFRTYLPQASAGNYTSASPLDSVRRLHAYRRLDLFPIVILVALPEAQVLATWRADATITSAIVALLVLMMVGLGTYLGIAVRKGQRMEQELAQLAYRDGLTGVANRRCFDDTLNIECRRAARERSPLSLLMIDVDCFKLFNDNYGHQRGDEVLRTVAAHTSSAVDRAGDLVARYGGEEFVVLLPNTNASGALEIAETIRHTVEELAIPSGDSPTGTVTISVGVACAIRTGEVDPSTLVRAADAALYKAKNGGRNRIVLSALVLDSGDTEGSARPSSRAGG